MTKWRQALGRWGENLAAHKLKTAGYTVIERNYRCTAGEMDIVAYLESSDLWVFVEVKTRRGDAHGRPEEAITPIKADRLMRVAESFLQERGIENPAWRVDVIAIELDSNGKTYRLRQIENAVSAW